jgi:hypothetical protein
MPTSPAWATYDAAPRRRTTAGVDHRARGPTGGSGCAVWELLARLLVSSVIVTVPFCLMAVMSGRSGGLLWLLFPVVYLPVFLAAAVGVFIPVERLSRAWDWPAVPALVVAGAALGALVSLMAASRGRKRSVIWAEVASGNRAVIGSILGLVVIGAAMGAVWRLSGYVVQYIGTT